MTDVLIQTRVPMPIARWLKDRADHEGDTVAGLLRRMTVTEAMRAIVPAWIYPDNQCDPAVVLNRGTAPFFFLQLIEGLPNGDLRFRLLNNERQPVAAFQWQNAAFFPNLDKYRFVLRGDHRPWIVHGSWENADAGCIEVVIRPEERRIVAAVKVQDLPDAGGLVAVIYSDGQLFHGEVDVQHGAYHYPVAGRRTFVREGWPTPPPELIVDAMRRAVVRVE